jgi:cyclopropane-fatty-acyl-phospholipid synthase
MNSVATATPIQPASCRISADVAEQARFLDKILQGYGRRDFGIRFWDGSHRGSDPGQPERFTLVFNHPGAVRNAFWPKNKCAFGEAYVYDDLNIEGDADALMQRLQLIANQTRSVAEKADLYERILRMPVDEAPRPAERAAQLTGAVRTRERDKQAIEHHYDGPPSSFYSLFLDASMQYSCAYFARPDEDIHAAQERKLDYICRKLQLKAEERLIDVGCGWGGLIIFAAKHYGVRATGISISKEQIKWANREIERQGLQDRCQVAYCDYRDAPELEPFDKAVSVGFIEHVGKAMLPTYCDKVCRLLKDQGLYLHHGITINPLAPEPPWKSFALKYVFPDGELLPITDTLTYLAKVGFEIRDVESLREHYMYTLQKWLQRLEANREEAIRLTDEVTYRIFRIYLAGAIQGFRYATYNLYQSLVMKCSGQPSGMPLSREHLYS